MSKILHCSIDLRNILIIYEYFRDACNEEKKKSDEEKDLEKGEAGANQQGGVAPFLCFGVVHSFHSASNLNRKWTI